MKRLDAIVVVVLLICDGASLVMRAQAIHERSACTRAIDPSPTIGRDEVAKFIACEHDRIELKKRQDYGTLGTLVLSPISVIAVLVLLVRRRRGLQ